MFISYYVRGQGYGFMCFRDVWPLKKIYKYFDDIFLGSVSLICMKVFDNSQFSEVLLFTNKKYKTVNIEGVNSVDCVKELYNKTYDKFGNNNILEYR